MDSDTENWTNQDEKTGRLFDINNRLALSQIFGFAMLALGLWLRFSSQTKGFFNVDLNTEAFIIVVAVLIASGTLMLLTALFGIYGSSTENKTSLSVFALLLTFMFFAEVAAGTFFITQSKQVGKVLSEAYSTIYLQYVNKAGDPSMGITLNFFHSMFECCGILGKVMEPLVRETCPSAGFFESITIPPCPGVIESTDYRSPTFIGGLVGDMALMLFALICSSILYKGISRASSDPPYILMSSSVPIATALPLANSV